MMQLNAQVPAELDRIVRRCLAKDPDRRWQTATDVRNELEIIQEARQQSETVVPEVEQESKAGRLVLGLVAAVVLVVVAVMGYWLGGSPVEVAERVDHSVIPVQAPDAVSILAPEGYELLGVQVSPDGRTLAMHTAKPEASARTSAKAGIVGYLHLRNMDSFETVLVSSSRGTEVGHFSPDGKALVFMVMPENPSRPMAMMRLDLPAVVPPVQIGTVLQATMGVQADDTVQSIPRGFCWSNADTIVAVTETPNTLLRINARTGSEMARIPLDFKETQRVIRILDAIDENTILLGTDRYAEGRYLQEVHWVDVQTGRTGLVMGRTSEAQISSDDSLLFTRGTTVFEIGYEASGRRTSGQERPVLSGLRAPNTWSGGRL